ncbi:MAG: domain containing protein, partial [Pseudonocardiales bacterium]|nr:domain containing protein [Pseudonocardiales bacterium]
CTNLACSFDGSTSSDPDGSVASYAWDFGDGTTGTGASASHTYAADGSYNVTLTVTDNQGATNPVSHSVTVAPAPNQSPTAVFTKSCTMLTCSFDGSTSFDSDGSVSSYAWDFGDGGTSTGSTASHTFAASGTYPVTLTVTDNQGATGFVTAQISVQAIVTYAADQFGRTTAGGWGTADTGGAWSVGGTAANYTVSGNAARMALKAAGASPTAYLNGAALKDTNSVVDFTLDKPATGGGAYVYVAARRAGGTDKSEYRLRAKVLSTGAVQLSLTKVVASGTETVLVTQTVTGLTFVAGQFLRMRLQVSGDASVSLTGKLWDPSATEPTSWQVSATDATSPLGAGAAGLLAYLSASSTNMPVTAQFQHLTITSPPTG